MDATESESTSEGKVQADDNLKYTDKAAQLLT